MRTNTELLKLLLQMQADISELIKLWGEDAAMMKQVRDDAANAFYESNSYVWPEDMMPKFLEASFLCGKDGVVTKENFNEYIHETYFHGHTDAADETLIKKQVDELWDELPDHLTNRQLTKYLIENKVTDDWDKEFFTIAEEKFYSGELACAEEFINSKSLACVFSEIRSDSKYISDKLASQEYEFRASDGKGGTKIKDSYTWTTEDKAKLNMIGKLYLDSESWRVQMNTSIENALKEHPKSAQRLKEAKKDIIIETPVKNVSVSKIAFSRTDLSMDEVRTREASLNRCRDSKEYEDRMAVQYGTKPEEKAFKDTSIFNEYARELKNEALSKQKKMLDEVTKSLEKLEKAKKKSKDVDEIAKLNSQMDKDKFSLDNINKKMEEISQSSEYLSIAQEKIKQINRDFARGIYEINSLDKVALGNTGTRNKAIETFTKMNGEAKTNMLACLYVKKDEITNQKEIYLERLKVAKNKTSENKDKTITKLDEKIKSLTLKEKRLSHTKTMLLDSVDKKEADNLIKTAKAKAKQFEAKEKSSQEKSKDDDFVRERNL